jgi:hypothetical protein
MQVQNVLYLLLCMHQDNIQVYAKHSVITAAQFWQLLFIFHHYLLKVTGTGGTQGSSFKKLHRIKSKRTDLEIMKARKWIPQLNHCPENCLFQKVVTSLWIYGGAPSC